MYIFGNVIQFPTFHLFYSKQDILCNYLKNPSKLRDAYCFSFLLHLTCQNWHSLACNYPITFLGYIKKNTQRPRWCMNGRVTSISSRFHPTKFLLCNTLVFHSAFVPQPHEYSIPLYWSIRLNEKLKLLRTLTPYSYL